MREGRGEARRVNGGGRGRRKGGMGAREREKGARGVLMGPEKRLPQC